MAPVQLTGLEMKLLRLALNESAAPGEVSVSAQKLIESLRRRGISAEAIESTFEDAQEPVLEAKKWSPDYGLCTMPWGKHKGERFMDISPYDLRSAMRWAQSKPDLAQRFAEFIHDVQEFFKQSPSQQPPRP
jgi:hypothetical protein